jgi:TPP-dependent pyruvate/acetoin dehydrogenase alpha subunit
MEATLTAPNLELPAAELERMYTDMVRIRSFEERVTEQFQAGAVKGTAHSYIGEEAIAVGIRSRSDPDRRYCTLYRSPTRRRDRDRHVGRPTSTSLRG